MPRNLQRGLATVAQWLLLAGIGLAQSSAPAPADSPASVEEIVTRMNQAQEEGRARAHAYAVIREYKLYDEQNAKPKTQLEAKIEFSPPQGKSYSVLTSTGGVGEKVVRRVLDREMDLSRDPQSVEMSLANYDFVWLGTEVRGERPCYVLAMYPKRADRSLIKGKVWIDAATYHIVHIEGTPTKDPSFWTRDVRLNLDFAEVDGMWLQTSTQATARVRWFGSFNLEGRDRSYQAMSGESTTARKGRGRSTSAMVVVGVVK